MTPPRLTLAPKGQQEDSVPDAVSQPLRLDPTALDLADIARSDTAFVLRSLATSANGLLDREAAVRLQLFGHNAIAIEQRDSWLKQLTQHFISPINLLLLSIAGISAFMGDGTSAVMISLMVVLSTLLSFVQEYRSGNAAEKLRQMVRATTSVQRQDKRLGVPKEVVDAFDIHLHPQSPVIRELPTTQLVPGDIIHLSAGDMVPADVRILQSKDLFANQSALTGESMPVEKHATLDKDGGSILELCTLCFMGSNVVSGTASAVVVKTGAATYFGKLAHNISEQRAGTSFDKGVERFAMLMMRFMLVMVPLVFVVNGLTKGDWMQAFLFAVAVAVGLAPEMLPMIVTINLSKGAIILSRKKVIVKRLNAIQNFGAMDVLCTDKTGTLTQGRVVLERHVDPNGEDCLKVLQHAYLNSYHQTGLKNMLDLAVLQHAEVHAGLEVDKRFVKVDEVPFDFHRRRMSVVVEQDGHHHLLVCKGAVEEMLTVCDKIEIDGVTQMLDTPWLHRLMTLRDELNGDGFMVIAVACRQFSAGRSVYTQRDEHHLTLLGFTAFFDPPRDTAAQALSALHQHGVAVKILTGDNEAVTTMTCHQVGLEISQILSGEQITGMSDIDLQQAVEGSNVFVKLAPEQKSRIIAALHANNHVVGFLGDGINDGPALKAADIGISVDSAVDIAKESADIILLEKSLMVLEQGVMEGRRVFGNIIKYLRMSASSNFGNMLSMVGASLFLPFLPMAPVQILLNNLFYDLSQTTIATDEVDPEYLAQPRQWEIANITRFMLVFGPISSVFDYVTYFTLLYGFDAWHSATLFHTGWFLESLLSQTLIVHIIRTGRIPFIESRASVPLLLTSVGICLLGLWLPFSPFALHFGLTPVSAAYGAALAAIVFAYLIFTQVVKAWFIRRYGLN
jgi:Mg2+-importing ATPase